MIIFRELYDFERNIEIVILNPYENVWTIAYYNMDEDLWKYTDIPFNSLKDAFQAHAELMENAPINKQI